MITGSSKGFLTLCLINPFTHQQVRFSQEHMLKWVMTILFELESCTQDQLRGMMKEPGIMMEDPRLMKGVKVMIEPGVMMHPGMMKGPGVIDDRTRNNYETRGDR